MSAVGSIKAKAQGERGQDLVEFALIFPILFMVLMGIFDMGRAIYYSSVLHNAAREGARYGSISPTDTAGINDAVERLAVGIPPADLNITIAVVPGDAYDVIDIAVEYDMPILTPLIGAFFGAGNQVPLGSEASMKIEAS